MIVTCTGCVMGSTDVNQQLKDIRDPNAAQEKARAKHPTAWLQPKHRLPNDQVVFKVYKGVKCFDFCKRQNIIVTGGKTH